MPIVISVVLAALGHVYCGYGGLIFYFFAAKNLKKYAKKNLNLISKIRFLKINACNLNY